MTITEFRESDEYAKMLKKVKGYPKGFEFTLSYQISAPKRKGLQIFANDCITMGLLESISFGLDIHGNCVEEKFRRT